MKNTTVCFNTYREALKAASNALKDGFNTVIHKVGDPKMGFPEAYVNEYFVRESQRFHDN